MGSDIVTTCSAKMEKKRVKTSFLLEFSSVPFSLSLSQTQIHTSFLLLPLAVSLNASFVPTRQSITFSAAAT